MRRILAPFLFVALAGITPELAAAPGDAQFGLGRATYRAGNVERAREYFEQAAAAGHVEASYILGLIHLEQKVAGADPVKAADWFRRAAEQGHLDAMNHYGTLLREGKGVGKNEAEAVTWFRKSAEGGDARGMRNFAVVTYQGVGTPADRAKAAMWYGKSAAQGNVDAMVDYGFLLSNGDGIPQDNAAALDWYLKAARAGNGSGAFNVAEYYRTGKGGVRNEAAARFWYLRAAMLGHEEGEKAFAARAGAAIASPEGEKLWDEANRIRAKASTDAEFAVAKKQAFPLYLQAAELGHAMSVAGMVDAYQYGNGVEKNMERAREWAQIAAELGNSSSQTILAQYMLHGTGGPRNTQGARFWFEQAALTGNSVARMFLAKIYDGEYGFPPNQALATYWWIEAYKVGNTTAKLELTRRGLLEPDPQSQAVIEKMHRDGPDRSSVEKFTYDVAVYCKFGGPRCHEFSIAARRFQQEHNASADAANMARLWNVYSTKDPDADRKWRERSDCMKKKTDALQRHTYGQQDWYYTGACH